MTALPSGREPYLPGGWRYDGQTRDYALNSTGQVRGVHWIDEGMALALSVDRGSIKASPLTGNRIRELLPYLGGENDLATVEACVQDAQPLKRYVEANQVTIDRVEIHESGTRLAFAVFYRNLLENSERNNLKRLVWYTGG